MRLPIPSSVEVDPIDAYSRTRWVGGRLMCASSKIASVDGAAFIEKRSKALGGPADKAIFAAPRSLYDVILVAAATMCTEGYSPVRLDDNAWGRRHQWGLAWLPSVVVITRACRCAWISPFFTEAEQRRIVIIVPAAATSDRDRAAEVTVADDDVDLVRMMRALDELGHDNVLAEGGLRVAAQLASAELHEPCPTVSVGGDARRILDDDPLEVPTPLDVRHVLEADGYLFLRHLRR
jgi:riboflavin biosynthesis pyrimidine reductase